MVQSQDHNRKITASGDVISVDPSSSSSISSSSSSSSWSMSSSDGTIDVFGFRLEPTQFAITAILVFIMLGIQGTFALGLALGAYALYQRATSSSSSSWPRAVAGTTIGSGRLPRGGGGGGSRIRGIADLPCDPKRG